MKIFENPDNILPVYCKLCIKEIADKKNSHIISKFLTKERLFESTNHKRQAIELNNTGKIRVQQDTPKEDYILCSVCEKRLEVLETYFSKIFKEINGYTNFPSKYRVLFDENGEEYIELNEIPFSLFKLFFCSIIWRTSISNLAAFKNYKLDIETEENIRVLLDSNLKSHHKDLIESTCDVRDIPFFECILMKPKEYSNLSRGYFFAFNVSEDIHLIMTVDYAFVFKKIIDLKSVNFESKKAKITLCDLNAWKGFNNKMIGKMA